MGYVDQNLLATRNDQYRVKLSGIVFKWSVLFMLFNLLLLTGCGPTIFTQTRLEYSPYNPAEYRQEKSGLIVEQKRLNAVPEELFVMAQKCDEYNQLLRDSSGLPTMAKVLVLPQGVSIYRFKITNNTKHVLRLNSAIIRLFDPAGNDYEPLDKDSLVQHMLSERPCQSTTTSIIPKLQLLKLIGRNTELLPNLTAKGYLLFKSADSSLPGIWKIRLYEVPIETDAAGRVTKTEKFELKTLVKKFIDTYRRENPFAKAVKIDTKEVE